MGTEGDILHPRRQRVGEEARQGAGHPAKLDYLPNAMARSLIEATEHSHEKNRWVGVDEA